VRADGVAAWALATAVELGLAKADALAVREAARLADVGLIYMPASVELRPRHLISGADLEADAVVARSGHDVMRGAEVPERACLWVLASRERFDGGGAPHGLAGEEIPLGARVIAAAAAYEDALSAPHRNLTPDARRIRVLAEVAVLAGRVLDPVIVAALERSVLRAGPAI
jgi:HD-GYP domain-containing protein (c-di-GMP phosphodiesterase class II)